MSELGKRLKLGTLQRRGSGLCVSMNKDILAQLAWNKGDMLRMDVIDGSLVLTKVVVSGAPSFDSKQMHHR